MRGVRTLQSTVRMPAPTRTASDAPVKFEPRSRIMNLTRCVCSPKSMSRLRACWPVHAPIWMLRDSEDADAPGHEFYHGQDMGQGAVAQVDCETVLATARVSNPLAQDPA